MAQMPSQQTDDDFRGLSLRYTLFFGCSDLVKYGNLRLIVPVFRKTTKLIFR
jgi:hypothetical protein